MSEKTPKITRISRRVRAFTARYLQKGRFFGGRNSRNSRNSRKFPKFPPGDFRGSPEFPPRKSSIFDPRINDYSRKIRKKPRIFPPKFGGKSPGIFPFCKETVFSVFEIFGNFQNFEQKSSHFTHNFSSILSANCKKTGEKSPPKKIRKKSARVVLEKKSANNFYTFL